MMPYKKPELEYIRFVNIDILTDSNELPFIPAAEDEEEDFA